MSSDRKKALEKHEEDIRVKIQEILKIDRVLIELLDIFKVQ